MQICCRIQYQNCGMISKKCRYRSEAKTSYKETPLSRKQRRRASGARYLHGKRNDQSSRDMSSQGTPPGTIRVSAGIPM